MKQVSYYSPLLRAFTFLTAIWIFALVVFVPINSSDLSKENVGTKFTVADASFILNVKAPSGKQSLPKASFLKFAAGVLEILLLPDTNDILEYKAIFPIVFISNVSFVFISAKGP